MTTRIQAKSVLVPAAGVGPYTVSLSIDINGIDADTPLRAAQVALEGLHLMIPALATSVDTGHVCHVTPEKGNVVEYVLPELKEVTHGGKGRW